MRTLKRSNRRYSSPSHHYYPSSPPRRYSRIHTRDYPRTHLRTRTLPRTRSYYRGGFPIRQDFLQQRERERIRREREKQRQFEREVNERAQQRFQELEDERLEELEQQRLENERLEQQIREDERLEQQRLEDEESMINEPLPDYELPSEESSEESSYESLDDSEEDEFYSFEYPPASESSSSIIQPISTTQQEKVITQPRKRRSAVPIINPETRSQEIPPERVYTFRERLFMEKEEKLAYVKLTRELCEILPFQCKILGNEFIYTFVFSITPISIRIQDILDDKFNSIYEKFYVKPIIHLSLNVNTKETFMDKINLAFFDLNEIENNITSNSFSDGYARSLGNTLVIQTRDIFTDKLKGPITIILDFQDAVDKSIRTQSPLDTILYPKITVYRCERSLELKPNCETDNDVCREKCRSS